MPHWLLKTEPAEYAFDDLMREKSTVWTGVTNALAQKHLRDMRKGDAALIYHSGNDRAVVGLAEVAADPTPDPDDPAGRRVLVTLKAKRKLATPVTLAQVKADPSFAAWELVRQARLSVMPVPADLWGRIATLAGG